MSKCEICKTERGNTITICKDCFNNFVREQVIKELDKFGKNVLDKLSGREESEE